MFFFYFVVCKVKSYSRVNTAEPRSKQKTMGVGARGENNYRESANKKTLKDRKQKTAVVGCMTSDLKTCHIILSKFLEGQKEAF